MAFGVDKALDQLPSAILALGLGLIACVPTFAISPAVKMEFLNSSELSSDLISPQMKEPIKLAAMAIIAYVAGIACIGLSNTLRRALDKGHTARLVFICQSSNSKVFELWQSSEKRAEILASFGISLSLFYLGLTLVQLAYGSPNWMLLFFVISTIAPPIAFTKAAAITFRDVDAVIDALSDNCE